MSAVIVNWDIHLPSTGWIKYFVINFLTFEYRCCLNQLYFYRIIERRQRLTYSLELQNALLKMNHAFDPIHGTWQPSPLTPHIHNEAVCPYLKLQPLHPQLALNYFWRDEEYRWEVSRSTKHIFKTVLSKLIGYGYLYHHWLFILLKVDESQSE